MNQIGSYPSGCELDAITNATIEYCDELDGIKDGVISNVDQCFETFNPYTMVGKSVKCNQTGDTIIQVSKEAAKVVNASWAGVTSHNDNILWRGYRPGSDLSGNLEKIGQGMACTNCTVDGCKGCPNPLGISYFVTLLAKDLGFDLSSMSQSQFEYFFRLGQQEYESLLATNNPDLSRFHEAGGKMVTFHGLVSDPHDILSSRAAQCLTKTEQADQFIPDHGTRLYYENVMKMMSTIDSSVEVQDFWRYFPVPGVAHCQGGPGGRPEKLFEQLRDWVEEGIAPDSSPVSFEHSGQVYHRIACPYPQDATYDSHCGDPTIEKCWSCTDRGKGHAKSSYAHQEIL